MLRVKGMSYQIFSPASIYWDIKTYEQCKFIMLLP